ncbi:MAG: hypothetical protein M0001_02240 [Treponema sp.]|nr:hypothetical protein [Treponema sp.]
MKRALFLSLVCVAVAALGASTPAAVALDDDNQAVGATASAQSLASLFSAGLPGRPISAIEASSIAGGDVFAELNADRTKMTVKVYTNNDELRRLRPTPIQSFQIDVHNRIVNGTTAPYMPADGYPVASGVGLTTRPGPFPQGTWNITDIREIAGKYGPFMVMTDAVGNVEVFSNGISQGRFYDTGYALHSSAVDFAYSRTYGCLQNRRADSITFASVLLADRAEAARERQSGRQVQMLWAGGRN